MKTCPSCRKESPSDEECTHCGIFFAKWEALHPAGEAASPVPVAAAVASAASSPAVGSPVDPDIPLVQLILETVQLFARAPARFLALSLMPFVPAALAVLAARNRLASAPLDPQVLFSLGKHLLWLVPALLFLFPYAVFSVAGLAHAILHRRDPSVGAALSAAFGQYPKYFAAVLLYTALCAGIYTEALVCLGPRGALLLAGKSIEANMYTVLLAPLFVFAVNFIVGTSLFHQMFYFDPDCGSLEALYRSYRHFPDIGAKLKYIGFLIVLSVFTAVGTRVVIQGLSSVPLTLQAFLLLFLHILSTLFLLLGGTVWAASHHRSDAKPLLK